MRMHVLITPQMNSVMPDTAKVVMDWGQLEIIVDGDFFGNRRRGLHCFVEDSEENLKKWMSDCDEFIKGSGSPQLESFTLIENGREEPKESS